MAFSASTMTGSSFVFDLDGLDAVGRRIAILGHDEGDLLVLEQHLAVGQHHLHVARQRRHPGEVDALQLLGSQHRQHARHLERLGRVDALDPACAYCERTKSPNSMPGSFKSSM